MADSDDYLFDDDILDDKAIAALDEAENSYFSTSNTTHHTTPPTPPPAKRQKTTHTYDGATETRASHRPSHIGDVEDLPDISVQDDGSYGIGPAQGSNVRNARLNANTHLSSTVVPLRSNGVYKVTTRSTPLVKLPPLSANLDSGKTNASVQQERALQNQLEQLQSQNAQLQVQLQRATDAKLTKEGEVSVLRKSMEKTARDHANELDKLKASRDESEAKQRQLQRELKEEIELLKTQFTFKQQEYQSSLHSMRVPGSVRSKRTGNNFPSTPLVTAWDCVAGPSDRPFETPRKSRFLLTLQQGSPQGARSRQHVMSPGLGRKSATLPGFENAFMPSSPVKSTRLRPDYKGKQKKFSNLEDNPFNQADAVSPSSPLPEDLAVNVEVGEHEPVKIVVAPDLDAVVADARRMEVPREEPLDEMEPFDWGAELVKMISTHTTKISNVLTLQLLIGVNTLTDPDATRYHEACAVVIRTLSNKFQRSSLHSSIPSVATAFMDMLPLLTSVKLISPLASLLDLLACLGFCFPPFCAACIAQPADGSDSPPLVTHLKAIVSQLLHPTVQVEHKAFLSTATVGLLEALCWNVSEEAVPRLVPIPTDPDTLPILLDRSQPNSLLTQTIRMLTLLATHPTLSHALLSPPDETHLTNVPLIEHLSSYVVDQRDGAEVDCLRRLLICLFGTMASTAELISGLANSPTLIPALCSYISRLSSPIWEDETQYLVEAGSVIETLGHTLFLLHHLVFSSQPAISLSNKLQQAPPKHFNGASHLFIVAFGRLSYAEPPPWMDRPTSMALERVVDIARDLLEHVVDGPEGDAIWEVYQGEFDNPSATDEGDMEAQFLGTPENGS